jgi:hypothetical protein
VFCTFVVGFCFGIGFVWCWLKVYDTVLCSGSGSLGSSINPIEKV